MELKTYQTKVINFTPFTSKHLFMKEKQCDFALRF